VACDPAVVVVFFSAVHAPGDTGRAARATWRWPSSAANDEHGIRQCGSGKGPHQTGWYETSTTTGTRKTYDTAMTEPAAGVDVQPVWCIVANIVRERPYGPGGGEQRRGLRLFAPGTKVYVPDGFAGMGYETVTVIGQTRGSRRYAIVHLATRYLTNWRVKLVYGPAVLDRIEDVCWTAGHGFSRNGDDRGSEAYRDDLHRVAAQFQQRTDEIHRQWASHRDPNPATSRRGSGKPSSRSLRRLARTARLWLARQSHR